MQRVVLALAAILALAYGLLGPSLYAGAAPYALPALFKASSVIVLGLVALSARSRLLGAGLLFGSLGDALLAWSHDTFIFGAGAFLLGHICYIALFLRAGMGFGAALKQPLRLAAIAAVFAASLATTAFLVPGDSALFAPLSVYTGVLTVMTITSFTLPAARWLAMAGAVLFFISDGFVAAHVFHADDPLVASFGFGFAGWMLYWAGQAALCVGALGLHKPTTT